MKQRWRDLWAFTKVLLMAVCIVAMLTLVAGLVLIGLGYVMIR